jgi:hypothetical protein
MTKQKLLPLCLLVIAGIFSSCKKDASFVPVDKSLPAAEQNAKLMKGDFTKMPGTVNGMLYFADEEQLSSYMDYLDNAVRRDEGDKSGVSEDPDDILEDIESQIGFVSLRHVTNAAFQQLNEVGWESPDQIPEKHFIHDITMRSILNSNADLRVGDQITHYINKDYAVSIDADATEKLEAFHNLPLTAGLIDIQEIDPTANEFSVHYLRAISLLIAAQRGTGSNVFMSTPSFTSTQICSNPLELSLGGLVVREQVGNSFIARTAAFNIQWGDGSSLLIGSPSSQNPVVNTSHQYPHSGTYTIVITAQGLSPFTGMTFSTGGSFQVNVPGGCNFNAQNSHMTDVRDNLNMNRFMRCVDWVEQWRSTFGGIDRHKIGANTVSYHLENNKWRESRIDEVGAEFSTTKYEGDCITNWGDNAASYNGNTRSAEASNQNRGKVGWFQVYCKHKIRVGSNVFTYNRTLTPCN